MAEFRVVDLRCDGAENPLGVDAVRPVLSWRVTSDERGQRQSAYRVLVATSEERLAANDGDVWDSGRVDSADTAVEFPATLRSSQRVFWKVQSWGRAGAASAWSEPQEWTTGLLRPEDWAAQWIGAPTRHESTLLRHEFTVKPGLRRAVAHVTGLGQYELSFNGRKAGDDLLAPGWTDYRDTTLYDTREVTALLVPGRNAVGITLGNGMYHVVRAPGRFAKFVGSFGEQRAIFHLRLEYADGSTEVVGTDRSWRTDAGPITFSSIYGGEDYDARKAQVGWDQPGFDDEAWQPARAAEGTLSTLRGHSFAAEPLVPIETRRPVEVKRFGEAASLYDFGQNAPFIPRLRVEGPAGSVVRLTAGELTKPDGSIERSSMGGAHRGSAWWQYTKGTDDEESWFPQFYYLGSRYVRAELAPATPGGELPRISDLEMVIVHSAAKPVGAFACSDETLNRIHTLIRWAQRANLVSILTDCPHREKLGWLEQTHLNGPALRYEFDVNRLFAKTVRDMAEAQTADGLVPNIAPEYTVFKGNFRAAAEWGAAFIQIPWQQYVFTGEVSLLREHYERMKRYLNYLEGRTTEGILAEGLGDWNDYAEGTDKRANLTPPRITATAFLYENTVLLGRIAAVLGKPEEASELARRAESVRADFNREFFRPDATPIYGTGSQTSLALPLAMGLAEPQARAPVLAALVRDLEARGHFSSGAVGFRYLVRALNDAGRADLLHRYAVQDDKPGYAYQLKRGATALTETWHASPGASQNHFFLGQLNEWLYRDLAGIGWDDEAPGLRHVIVRPQLVDGIEWAEASYEAPAGKIVVRWERQAGGLRLSAVIPANATASVYLPARSSENVQESGQPARAADGVTWLREEKGRQVFRIESGTYEFNVRSGDE